MLIILAHGGFATDNESDKPTAYIVDKFCEGYSISEPWHKIAIAARNLLDVYFKDVKVPLENVLGKVGRRLPGVNLWHCFRKVGISSIALGGILPLMKQL